MHVIARRLLFLFFVLLASASAGCKTTHSQTTNTPSTHLTADKTNALPTRYTNEVRAAKCYPKWNPVWWFGNVDSPTPPDWYRPDDPHRTRRWHWRNSLHNFTHYVIGIYDKPFVRVGKYPDRVFAPDGGWNWAISKYKCLRLPFVSYRKGDFKFYFGWRERGNFGVKLNF